jgi:hypothetical protein
VSEFKFIAMAVVAILLVIGIDNAVGGEQPNNEPYVGLCTDPTTQGGC